MTQDQKKKQQTNKQTKTREKHSHLTMIDNCLHLSSTIWFFITLKNRTIHILEVTKLPPFCLLLKTYKQESGPLKSSCFDHAPQRLFGILNTTIM